MPYQLVQKSPRCFSVVNTETGTEHSKCSSKKKAQAQMRLLYGVETGWKPSSSYREFVSSGMRKRPTGTLAKDWMMEIGKRWQELKNK